MAALAIKQFSGVAPRIPARYLQDAQAQVAVNCPVFNGPLQPLLDNGASLLTLPKSGTIQSMYRFGQSAPSDTQYWFHWTSDVDVVKGPVANDTSEITVFTGLDYPRITDVTQALSGGTNYPVASYRLGVPAPSLPPTLTTLGDYDSAAAPETRVYVLTWVNSWGQESAPSEASLPITISFGQGVRLSGMPSVPAGEYNITKRRIYRSVNGTYLFVVEIDASTNTYDDYTEADTLAEELPSLTWEMPPSTLKGVVAGPNGVMAGFTGNDLYFCEPFRPFAWPVSYMQTVDYPIVGLGVMDTTIAVLTTGVPYFAQGAHPDSMTVVRSDIEQSCVSKRSIVSFSGNVIYASPDGLVLLSPGGSKIITEGLFLRDQWQSLNPSSIHAYQHDMKYVGFYDTGTQKGGFIYDLASNTFVFHTLWATAAYSDLVNDTLYICDSSRQVRKWAIGAPLTYQWRSKKFSMPKPLTFSAVTVEAEAYPVTAKIYRDGALLHTQTVSDRLPFRLPAGVGRDWEVELTGNTEVFAVALGQSVSELSNV